MSFHTVLPMNAQGQDKRNYRNSICLFIYIQISYFVGSIKHGDGRAFASFPYGLELISFSTGSVIAIATLHILVFTIDFYVHPVVSTESPLCQQVLVLPVNPTERLAFVLDWKWTLINGLYCLFTKIRQLHWSWMSACQLLNIATHWSHQALTL